MSDNESLGSVEVQSTDDHRMQLTITNGEATTQSAHSSQEEDESGDDEYSSVSRTSTIEQEDEQKRSRSIATVAWRDGNDMIIEDQYGEIMRVLPVRSKSKRSTDSPNTSESSGIGRPSTSSPAPATVQPSPNRGSISRVTTSKSTSSEESSASPLSKPKHQRSDQQIFAHQTDKMVILENGDGDIIRRYRIESVNPNTTQKKKLKLATKNALRKLTPGVKRKSAQEANDSQDPVSPTDTSFEPHNVLVKDYDMNLDKSPLRNPKVEKKVEDKLNTVINQEHRKSSVAKLFSKKPNSQLQSATANS